MPGARRVLIVGVGSIGERHLRCFQATGRANLSICEPSGPLRERIAQKYGIPHAYPDLRAALADHHDAAVVATPAHLHLPMSASLAEAGTHLLIEKPLATSLEGLDSLQSILSRRNVKAAVAYVLRHHPALRAMRDALLEGRFGRPVELVAVSGQHFPTYRPAYRQIYYADRATGGGAVQDALTHVINAGQWLVGPAHRLVADAAHQVLEGVNVEDTVHVIARHGDVLSSYSLNQHQAPGETTITVVCERGACRVELHRHRWRWMAQPETPWQDECFSGIERDDLFIAQANAFLDLIEERAEPTCSLQEAADTLRASLAILASIDAGTWVKPQ